ncbi:hypothetical protein C1645_754268 [Glomus cerebriforme]|uniref:Uncharacterized protein n=1 Tax=Glomus cerebriforme TaxID=658196 RepID=A0A397TH62_9GLOM|nr:hypothetical protein C1645_754268 [Glomus cerebriforme]
MKDYHNIPERNMRTDLYNGSMDPFHGYNNNNNNIHSGHSVSIIDNQNNLGNCYPQQNSVGTYTHHYNFTDMQQQQVAYNNIPQHIPDRNIRPNYGNSFHENIGNNAMIPQAVPLTDINQNNNNDNRDDCVAIKRVDYVHHSRQQVDLSPQQHVLEKATRPDTNLFHENNIMTTQTTDINQNYNDDCLPNNDYIVRQDVIGVRDYTQVTPPQQQFDNTSHHTSEKEIRQNYTLENNEDNNVMTTQAIMMTDTNQNNNDGVLQSNDYTSHQDVVGNNDTHPQQQTHNNFSH